MQSSQTGGILGIGYVIVRKGVIYRPQTIADIMLGAAEGIPFVDANSVVVKDHVIVCDRRIW